MKNAVGLEAMIDTSDEDYPLIQYLAGTEAKLDKLFEDAYLIKTPIVRNGNKRRWVISPISGKPGNNACNKKLSFRSE